MRPKQKERDMVRKLASDDSEQERYRAVFKKIRKSAREDFGIKRMPWEALYGKRDVVNRRGGTRFGDEARQIRKRYAGCIRVGPDPGFVSSAGEARQIRVLLTMRQSDVTKITYLAAALGFDTAGEYLNSLIEADYERCELIRVEQVAARKRDREARTARRKARIASSKKKDAD